MKIAQILLFNVEIRREGGRAEVFSCRLLFLCISALKINAGENLSN
jgi:hypothetical protein